MGEHATLHMDLPESMMKRLKAAAKRHGRAKGTEAGWLITAVIAALQDERLKGYLPLAAPETAEELPTLDLKVKLWPFVKAALLSLRFDEKKSCAQFCRQFLDIGLRIVESLDQEPLSDSLAGLIRQKLLADMEQASCHKV